MMLTRRGVSLAIGAAYATLVEPAWGQAASDEMSIGDARAPLHLIEYASLTCAHCAQFHASNWEILRARYIDTGRVRFTMREMATPPAQVAFAMFQVARANNAAAEEYLRRVKILFERQTTILGVGILGEVRDALIATGGEFGLAEADVMAAITDRAGAERLTRSIQGANALGVTHTPSFLFNGVLDDDHAFMTPDGMVRMLEARLAG